MWSQPSENSLSALKHGMAFADGIEFDIRIDADGELVIFHDEFLPGSGSIKPRCIENIYTDELRKRGVLTFTEMINDREFLDTIVDLDGKSRSSVICPILSNIDTR